MFQNLKWRNFLSTGTSWCEIALDDSKSTLIVGPNGAGKSTMLDALTFGLFGKPFRKINKPQLVSSINEKDMVVEIDFKIGPHTYLVRRGLKPARFEIWKNDKLLNQDASAKDYQQILEKSILKLNFKSFTQIVVLGNSSFIPFMQLTLNHIQPWHPDPSISAHHGLYGLPFDFRAHPIHPAGQLCHAHESPLTRVRR